MYVYHLRPPAVVLSDLGLQGREGEGAHPGPAQTDPDGQGPLPGEVVGDRHNAGYVHQAKPDSGHYGVGDDQPRQALGDAPEPEAQRSNHRPGHANLPSPEPEDCLSLNVHY